jgi:hypothetical protein
VRRLRDHKLSGRQTRQNVLFLFSFVLWFWRPLVIDEPPPLLDPVSAHRVKGILAQALRNGCLVREAKGEARVYLKAISPALPRAHVAEAIDELLAELDPPLGDLIHCEMKANAEPSGQLRLGIW